MSMPLTAQEKESVLASFSAFLESRPDFRNDPVAYTKSDVRSAINAMDAAIDAAIPAIRQSAGIAIPGPHKNRLLRFILERKVS